MIRWWLLKRMKRKWFEPYRCIGCGIRINFWKINTSISDFDVRYPVHFDCIEKGYDYIDKNYK